MTTHRFKQRLRYFSRVPASAYQVPLPAPSCTFLCQSISDAIQRKPHTLQRNRSRRPRQWLARGNGRSASHSGPAQSVQRRSRTTAWLQIQRPGGILLEVHGRRVRFQHHPGILRSNFPIQFRKSKIDGALARVTLKTTCMASAPSPYWDTADRASSVRKLGGINFGTASAPVARPDHDQGFEQTTNLQYQFSQSAMKGLWDWSYLAV